MTKEKTHYSLIIIGSGPAGLTAALYASRGNLSPLVINGPKPGGQLMGTNLIENWPGQVSILGPKLMTQMKEHAAYFGTEFLDESVISVDFKAMPFKIITTHKILTTSAVIIATGASPKTLGCPGEDKYWGKGVTTCAVCDAAFYKNMPVVIVGGGDTAMEDASFLLNFTDKITIIQISDQLSASAIMQKRVLNNPKITIIYNATVSEIKGNGQQVTGVVVKHTKTNQTQEIEANGVFIAIGLNPNVTPFKGQIVLNKQGFIQIENHTKTNIPGIFVAGDVTDFLYRQAITAAGAGCMAALDAERYLKSL